MKKRGLAILFVCVLIAGAAAAEAWQPNYDGLWVRVRESAMEIFLPTNWKIASEKEAPEGLLAEDPETKMTMRLSLSPYDGKAADAILKDMQADAGYANAELVQFGGASYVLADQPAEKAYVGVLNSEYFSMKVTFTFAPADTPEARRLAESIMSTLREFAEGNG